jgi:tetratricopeptide (TPR) repeat protein
MKISSSPMPGKDKVGPYKLLKTVGRGGMGAVYLAEHTGDKRRVALKLLPPEHANTPERVARFLREGMAGTRLHQPNIVETYEVGEDAGTYFIALEYIQGESLRQIMDRQPLGQRESLQFALQIAEALTHAHAQNVVHRDLKPDNIMVAEEGTAKVMDFGLAKVLDATSVTATGVLMGTAAYISPEQARGEETDARSDLYSLGTMLYEMLTGHPPFAAENTASLIFKHVNEEPLPARRLAPELLPAVDSLLWRLLHKQPAQRFQSAVELASALRVCLEALDTGTVLPANLFDPTLPHDVALTGAETPLVGREQEMAYLGEQIQSTITGRGGFLLVSGEAGLGKTRLVQELQLKARNAGMLSLTGHCLYQEDPNPYLPFAEILQSYLDTRETLVEAPSGEEQDEIGHLIARLSSFLPYTATPQDTPPQEMLGWTDAQTALFETVRQVLEALSVRQPLILCVEDLQWASATTLRLLHYLARNIQSSPILMVGTYRTEDLQEEGDGEPHPLLEITRRMSRERLFQQITLAPLNRRQSDDLVRGVLPGVPENADFLDLIYRETEGNPFFILEALRLWQEEGKLIYTETGWRLTAKPEEMRVPQRVHEVVVRRVERVDDAGREVLDVAAVMGRRFTVETISVALGLPRVELLRRLGRLEKKHQLIRFDSGHYAFNHHVIRDVLYGELAEPLRVEYHLILARRLEDLFAGRLDDVVYDLAHHFCHGEDYEAGLRYAQAATDRAEKQWALEEALHFNNLALQAISRLPSDTHYLQQEFAIRRRRAALLQIAGELSNAAQELEKAVHLSQHLGDESQEAEALTELARIRARRGEWETSLELADKAMGLADRAGDSATIAQALSVRGMVLFQTGSWEDALDSLRWATGLVEASGSGLLRARLLGNIGNVLDAQGRKDEAIQHYQQAIQVFEADGRILDSARGQLNLGFAYASMGKLHEAETCYRDALASFRKAGDVYHTALTHQHLADLEVTRGSVLTAADLCQTARDVFVRIGDDLGIADTSRILGRIAALGSDTAQAHRYFAQAIDSYHELGDRLNWAGTSRELGRLLARTNMVDQAMPYMEAARGAYIELGLEKEISETDADMVLLNQGVPMGGASAH